MTDLLDSRAAWSRLAISLGTAVVGNAGMWSIVVVMPAIQAEFGTGRGAASLPYTATMIGFAIGNLTIGRAVDRFGISRSLILAALACSLGYLAALASGSNLTLMAAQLVIGLGSSAFFGPLIADISLWFRRRRGIAVAIAASGNYVAGAVWPLILSGVLAQGDWRQAYLLLAICSTVIVVPLALFLSRRLPEESLTAVAQASSFTPQRVPYSPRALMWLLGLAGIGCCVAMSMPQVHIVAFCVDLGYGPAVGAEMLSLMLLGGVGSRLVSGLVADWLGGVKTLLIGSVLQMLALILYLPSSGLTSLYVVSLVFGLSQGGIVPSYALIVREYMPAREAGARVGFVIMITILGMALGGWLSGVIYEMSGSYTLAFVNGIAFNGLNIAIMVMILMRSRPRAPRPLDPTVMAPPA